MDITSLLTFTTDCFYILYGAMEQVFSVLNSSMNSLMGTSVDNPLYNYPLAGVVLGVGFSVFVIISFIKWVADIIT